MSKLEEEEEEEEEEEKEELKVKVEEEEEVKLHKTSQTTSSSLLHYYLVKLYYVFLPDAVFQDFLTSQKLGHQVLFLSLITTPQYL